MGGETDKVVEPAPPLISSAPLLPAFTMPPLQSAPGGNSLAALGAAPMPAAMLASPTPWSSMLDAFQHSGIRSLEFT